MRKLTFIKSGHPIKKLLIYESPHTVYLFLYDAFDDRPSVADFRFNSLEEAEAYCQKLYDIDKTFWISIPDPLPDCQYDFIAPKKVKGRGANDPKWGQYQYLNDKWVDISTASKYVCFEGMTKNEYLFVTGLLEEFDHARQNNPLNAFKILLNLSLPIDPVLYFSRT